MNPSPRSELFRALHVSGRPLVLVNVWDVGSATVVAGTGARAIATSSWAVAAALGYPDGERVPAELALAMLERIVAAVSVPCTVDIESGYGASPEAVARTVRRVAGAGACGCNLEDGVGDGRTLRTVAAQAARIRSARQAASESDPGFFINARTDVFMIAPAGGSDEGRVREVIERGHAYKAAGADGLFVPGLLAPQQVDAVVRGVGLPVNVMLDGIDSSWDALRAAGVARVSFGPAAYLHAMAALRAVATRSQLSS